MKTFLALEVLPLIVAVNQPCDLSGILAKQPNGKFDFGEHKLKFAPGRIYDDLKLLNKGKMKKVKAEFHHRNADDSSDAWVVCNKAGHKAQYYLSCSADGVLTVGPSKDSTGVTLPDCSNWIAETKTPICDRDVLGPFTTDVAPCHKNNCFRYCGNEMEGKTNRTFKKIKCNCDWASNTCTYQHKPKGSTDFVDFDPTAEKQYPNCGVDPTNPPPPAQWSEWGAYSVCSAGCGDGSKSRSRTCSVEGECEGTSLESAACNEGDCIGCKVNFGDWSLDFTKKCDFKLSYDDSGSFIFPPKGKCPLTMCKKDVIGGTLICACTKKGICTLKHDYNTLTDDFDSFNECTSNRNFRDGKRTFTWATGRRSPDVSASLDEGMELLDYCYDPNWFNLYEMRPAGGDGPFWKLQGGDLAALEGVHIKETMTFMNYGRVTEIVNADGERQLVCRYSNNKDFEVDREIYVQLAIRTGAVNWVSSERWFPQYNHAYNLADKPAGMWSEDDWVLHAKDIYAYGVELEFNSYSLFSYGDTPGKRAICRINYEGKWYLGNVNNEGQYKDVPKWSTSGSSWGSSYRSNWFTCAALLDDGTMITAETHQLFGKPESSGGLKSEYLVQNKADDGSSWDEWGEWTPCSQTCGDRWSATRTRTRECQDKDGNSIDKKTGWNCLPKRRDNGDFIYDKLGDQKCEVGEGYSGETCPYWGDWSKWGECSQTCGGGEQTKIRKCVCDRNDALCDDSEHPLHDVENTDSLCNDQPNIASQECNDTPCDGNGMAKGDGNGPGCLSDTRYSNMGKFNCYNTVDQEESDAKGAHIYENNLGFVPHNYACFSSQFTCDPYSQVREGLSERIESESPIICNCNDGSCIWENIANSDADNVSVRADCTRGYEWIKLPISPGSELYDNIVDFTTGKSGGATATSAIVVQKIAYAPAANFGWNPRIYNNWARRVPIDPVVKDDNGVFDKNGRDAYALVSQCDSGEMRWIEGPYKCSQTCGDRDESCFNDDWGGFQCAGSPRVNPFYDVIKKFSKDMDNTSAADWSVDAWVVAMCRFKDENNEWKMGNLLQFQWHYKYKSGWSSYWNSKEEDFQCCPVGGSGATGTPSDTLGCWPQRTLYQKEFQGEGGSYTARPYQILDSFNCKTAGMGHWSEWSEWSDCSKQCSNGESEGVRTKTRSCINANVGDFGCHDSTTTEIKERCNMLQTADCDNSNRCNLDLNYIDWKRFRLGHTISSDYDSHYDKQTAFWANQGVYYNVRENEWEGEKWSDKNGRLMEKTWTGTFPEGTIISGFRCVDPNTSERGTEEHSASCVCTDDECDWDRQLPVCSTHGQNHSGYSWTMTSSPNEGAICVSANTGGVGVVTNNDCVITMANEVHSFYMISNDAEMFKANYPAFNNYYDSGDARVESEFHTLAANDESCNDAFTWVAVSDLTDESPMVNAPRMYNQYEMINTLHANYLDPDIYPTRWTKPGPYAGMQKTGICRVTYENGKVCYGKYFNGKCGDYDVTATEENSDSYYSYTYEVMVLADKDGCSAPAAHNWSACSVDCGIGISSNGDETRTCHAVCETDAKSGQYCSVPKFPNDSNPQNSGTGNNNIEVFADYPVNQRDIDARKGLQLTCTGGGYWADDLITNDKYYVLAPGEKCTFSCDESIFERPHVMSESYPYWQSFTCDGNKGILDDSNWQHNWQQMPTCDPEFCIFPSYGKWLSKNIQGTKVQIGMNCPEGAIDNGDHVIVTKGVTCYFDCVAANGEGFRIESAQVRENGVTCQTPIPKANLAEYGCNNGECDTDFILNGPNKANWPNNRVPSALDNQQHKTWPYIEFSEQFDNTDLMKCYPNIDDACDPSDLGFNEDTETAEDVSWTCPNGHGSGAVCTKTCTNGFLGGKKSEKTCDCKSKCQWKGSVASCERAFCVIKDNFSAQGGPQWPRSATCTSADGSTDFGVFNENTEYPFGTVCSDKCKKYQHTTDFTEFSSCECSDGRCSFNVRKMGHCIDSVCDNSVSGMFSEFELGYEHPEATSDGFLDHLVDCTETVPQDWEDQSIAGLPLMGSKCYLKCKEGYRFADEDKEFLDDQDRLSITCIDSWYHGMEWNILENAWDKYGDCNGDYGNNCGDYPECIPED